MRRVTINERLEAGSRGRDHPDTLIARASIAYWTGQCGDSAEALRLYRELLPDLERVLVLPAPGARHGGPGRQGPARLLACCPAVSTAPRGTDGPRPGPRPAGPRSGRASTPRLVTVSNRIVVVHGPRAYTCRAHTRRGRGHGRSRNVAGHAEGR